MILTLMFRPYCHLCHQMLEALQELRQHYQFEINIIEIDHFPELEAKYNELVPVLLHQDQEICHWHLNKTKLINYLENYSRSIKKAPE